MFIINFFRVPRKHQITAKFVLQKNVVQDNQHHNYQQLLSESENFQELGLIKTSSLKSDFTKIASHKPVA